MEIDWTASIRKGSLKWKPLSTSLLVSVMEIEAAQYERIGGIHLMVKWLECEAVVGLVIPSLMIDN